MNKLQQKDYYDIKYNSKEFSTKLLSGKYDENRGIKEVFEYIEFYNDMVYKYRKKRTLKIGDGIAIYGAIDEMFANLTTISNVYDKDTMRRLYKKVGESL